MNIKNMMLTVGLGVAMTGQASAAETIGNGLEYAAKGFTLAEIELSNGNTVKFIEVPEMDTVMMGEIVPVGDQEQFVLDLIDGDFLQTYLQLTPEYVPVPQKLIDISLSEANLETPYFGPAKSESSVFLPLSMAAMLGDQTADLLAHRSVTAQLNEPVFMDLSELGFDLPASTKSGGSGSCNNSTGYQYFKDHHCGTAGNQGYGKSEGYCYNAMSQNLQKTSAISMRTTYTRHATCGSGNGRVRHSRNSAGGFFTYFDAYSAPNTVEKWQSKKSGVAWKRRVAFNKMSGSGYVRGWVKYYKQIVQ